MAATQKKNAKSPSFQRPFLKWAGGKIRVLPHILKVIPNGNRLIEPFVGSGAVFLNADFDSYTLADINPDLIRLYRTLQLEGNDFIAFARHYFSSSNNSPERYYSLRERFNELSSEVDDEAREKAALFLYLNRHCYNGLCRYNSSGGFNVPFGSFKAPYFPAEEMSAFHRKAQLAEFVCADFRPVLKKAKRNDVVYCDPPYVPLSATASFTTYARLGFSALDQLELAGCAEQLAAKGIPVLISNHNTSSTRKLYVAAKLKKFSVRRLISCNGTQRGDAKELLAVYGI